MAFDGLSGLSIGALVGTFFTALISHFLEKSRLKEERKTQLKKEIYFEKEKSLKKIIENIDYINSYISSVFNRDLNNDWKSKMTSIDTIGAIEVGIKIYAPFLESDFNEYENTLYVLRNFRKCSTLSDSLKTGHIPVKKESYQINEIVSPDYFTKKEILITKILDVLTNERSELLK